MGSQGIPALIDVLKNDRADVEMTNLALETLINLTTPDEEVLCLSTRLCGCASCEELQVPLLLPHKKKIKAHRFLSPMPCFTHIPPPGQYAEGESPPDSDVGVMFTEMFVKKSVRMDGLALSLALLPCLHPATQATHALMLNGLCAFIAGSRAASARSP